MDVSKFWADLAVDLINPEFKAAFVKEMLTVQRQRLVEDLHVVLSRRNLLESGVTDRR